MTTDSTQAGAPTVLSVITVCRNDRQNLIRTVESLQAQSVREGWEHIVVDGASTDGTQDWYLQLPKTFPSKLVSRPDNGIFDAMNSSLAIASGEYIAFINAGDTYADEEALSRALERIRNGPAWGYSKAVVVDGAGRQVRIAGRVPYSYRSHLYGRSTICHQAVIMRSDFLRELGGFAETFGAAGDYHLLLRAARQCRPQTWPTVDIHYLAGGVSDREVYPQLWRRHRARVNVTGANIFGRSFDLVFTAVQTAEVWARKKVKPLLRRQGQLAHSERG